ncbi:MAG: hypothetical protein CMC07_07330 [Flavobacteriaceae bacterium]|nr:hypothetical protein [Flavobacteriaceae bacterium]HBY67626.1 hypothetical protein [Flavobacteriaceae bacterium]
MRPRIVFILTIALSLYNSAFGFAQSVKDSKGPPPPNETRTPGLAIDNDLYILLVVGLLLGVYFIVKKYRSNDIPA